MSNTLVFMLWLTFMAVAYGEKQVSVSQVVCISVVGITAVMIDVIRYFDWCGKK